MDRCRRKAMAQGLAAWAGAPINELSKNWGWIWALASAALWLGTMFWVAFDPSGPAEAAALASRSQRIGEQQEEARRAQLAWEKAGKPGPSVKWRVLPDGSALGSAEIRLPAGSVGAAGEEAAGQAGGAGGEAMEIKHVALGWLGACMAFYGFWMAWSYMAGLRRSLGSWQAAAGAWDARDLAEHFGEPCERLWDRIGAAQATRRFFPCLRAGTMAGLGAAFAVGSAICSLAAAAATAALAAGCALSMAAGPLILWLGERREISSMGQALAWAGCAVWAYAVCSRLLIPGCSALLGGWIGKAAKGAQGRAREFCGRLESMGRGAYAQEERALLGEGCQAEGKRQETGKGGRL